MLIISKYVAKHELRTLRKYIRFEDIIEGCRKVLKNLATEIRIQEIPKKFRFFKVRIGRKDHGRMIVFLITENQKIVPILIRLKKDKIFGMNMSANNQEVADQIHKNLNHILNDIVKKEYEEFKL